MHKIVNNLIEIKKNIFKNIVKKSKVNIIAVSKTIPIDDILPLMNMVT